ncbi:hypothetical protein [Hydrotalea sp.]|uniref:CBU_0592 family membrane protein n=1 Tax=Hydrotalea sp. TaxID=2881279 RepID=UPI00260A727C|nr:hypothetical protein [Hydrotalea sp.]
MTHFNLTDWIGFMGVCILLMAYLLQLLNLIGKESVWYVWMNIVGAGLSCLASILIHYLPFIILEATWMLVSVAALFRKKHHSIS